MKYLKIYALFGGLVFLSCEKVIEPKNLPQQDPRMVLNSIIYPESKIIANISVSRSIVSGKDYKYVDNAVCDLYENGIYAETMTHFPNGNYASFKMAKANNGYTIKVSASGFKSVEASTSILRDAITSPVIRYDSANSFYRFQQFGSGTNIYGSTKFRFTITDDPTLRNQYSVEPFVILKDTAGTPLDTTFYVSITNYVESGNLSSNNVSGPTVNFDDLTLVNGNEVQVDIGVDINGNIESNVEIGSIEVYLLVHNLSEEYYKYKTTLEDQQINTGGLNLFAEPVMVYSNVSNGMGIFAGDNRKTMLVYRGKPKK